MTASIRKQERLALIDERLAHKGVLRLRDAVTLLGVSEMTVRRMLAESAERFSYYGGYILPAASADGPAAFDLQQEAGSNAAPKARACEYALALVQPDDTIFIDCGTTLDNLARLIPNDLPLTVICYSLNVANWLSKKPRIQMILLGGQFHPESASFAGVDGWRWRGFVALWRSQGVHFGRWRGHHAWRDLLLHARGHREEAGDGRGAKELPGV